MKAEDGRMSCSLTGGEQQSEVRTLLRSVLGRIKDGGIRRYHHPPTTTTTNPNPGEDREEEKNCRTVLVRTKRMETEGGCGPRRSHCFLSNLKKKKQLHLLLPPRPLRSKQADRWWHFPGMLKPVVEEAISYHGDWLEGEGVGVGAVFC